MSQQTSRRAFLSARILRQDSDAIRPPGAAVLGFGELCTKCGDCVPACPEGIITVDADGFPVVELNTGSCTFCGACARSCAADALVVERLSDWPWRAAIEGAACLSIRGVSCRLCQDSCDHGAIRFRLQLGGRAEPKLDLDTCTGCGACAHVCPADAVTFERHANYQSEEIQ
ncbi:ferredoxin-type protein NapF [Ruegeria hyattellae]|jgi:ferredoxin-type protein NapF|uniref:ferredoxin-type protein NapF n=1 Tax=Ruegeria hyattellae TaxID=3233337 RepID=UPI00355C8C81